MESAVTKLVKIDLEKEEKLQPPKNVDVGFAVKAIANKLQMDKEVSPLQIQSFFIECKTFITATIAKSLER